MGFSLSFARMKHGDVVDADRSGLATFFRQRGLEIAPSQDSTHHLRDRDGDLTFDGRWSDLHLDALDQEEPVTGGIRHASLTDAECTFVYDLCVAGQMLIINPQGAAQIVVPGRSHLPADIPEGVAEDRIAWVDDARQLAEALAGDFATFVRYKIQVIGGPADN